MPLLLVVVFAYLYLMFLGSRNTYSYHNWAFYLSRSTLAGRCYSAHGSTGARLLDVAHPLLPRAVCLARIISLAEFWLMAHTFIYPGPLLSPSWDQAPDKVSTVALFRSLCKPDVPEGFHCIATDVAN